MIAFIEGEVASLREHSLVLRCGALGVELFAPKPTLVRLTPGQSTTLHTHLVVKEELLALYGFHEPDLLEVFRHLISVSGIGPKLALAILSALPVASIAAAINSGDAAVLASAPGVGKRTAERMILELSGKLPEWLAATAGGAARPGGALGQAGDDAVQALVALGYREGRVKQVVSELVAAEPDEEAEGLIRKALGKLR